MAKKKKSKNGATSAQSQGAISKVRGQGDYYSDKIKPLLQANIPEGTFANYGDKLGSMVGTRVDPSLSWFGGKAGRKLGSWISRVVGFGDYNVMDNSLIKTGGAIPAGELIPDFGVFGNSVRVRHREYIQDMVVPASPTAFTNSTFVINPGNTTMFPWLATVAAGFNQYQVNGMIVEFKSMTSPVNTGGPLGTVVMATNYDVLDAPYVDKIRMENAQYSCSAAPSAHQMHTIECAPRETTNKIKYVRTPLSSTTVSQDARWMDHGLFQIATTGLAGSAGQVLGELWCSYDVTFFKPVATEIVGFEGQRQVAAVNISNLRPFGDVPVQTGVSYATFVQSGTFVFGVTGSYLIAFSFSGTGCSNTTTGTAARTRIQALVDGPATNYLVVDRVSVSAVGQTYICTTGASTSVSASNISITPFSYTI